MRLVDVVKTGQKDYLTSYNAVYLNKKGNLKVYEMVSHNKNLNPNNFGNQDKSLDEIDVEAVGIVAYNEDHTRILIQKEFRLACNDWVYNFPGGMKEPGESSEDAARRELKEETGLNITKVLDFMPACYSAMGFTDETVSTIICEANGEFSESTSPDEEIEVGWYTKDEVKEMLKTCKMSMRTQTFLYCWVNSI